MPSFTSSPSAPSSPPQAASKSGRSFQDYHLIVDDNDQDAAALLMSPLLSSPTAPGGSTTRMRRFSTEQDNADAIYFDEETTLPSVREEQAPEESSSPQRGGSIEINPHRRRGTRLFWNTPHATAPPLSRKNILNVVTYAVHVFVAWGIGIYGLNGTIATRWQITTKYASLVTPAPWSYHLWAPILLLEGAWAVAQLRPEFRNRSIVQDGISYWFFYTAILQTIWTVCFSMQWFIPSFVAVVLATACLISLCACQVWHCSGSASTGNSAIYGSATGGGVYDYILFRLPFLLHTGWMLLMTANHLALLTRVYETSVAVQLALDVVCLALLLATGIVCLVARPPYQDFCIPMVLIWSLLGIAARLNHPTAALIQVYGQVTIDALQMSALFLAGTLLLCLLPCIVVWVFRTWCVIHVVSLDED